jgi:DNA ligase-1
VSPYDVLIKLKETKGKKAKVKLLKKYESQWLRDIVKNALDPFITFGVKTYVFEEEIPTHLDFEHELGKMAFVLNELSRRSLKGNSALEAIKKASAALNDQQRYVFQCVLDKDLKCGVGAATANEAFPGIIPVWKMQKANKLNKKKLVFPCLAEIKENGRGNTAVVNGDEVKHFSNNGKENSNMNYFDDELIRIASGMPMVIFGEVRGKKGRGKNHFEKSQSLGAKNCDMTDMVFVIWDMVLLGEFKRQRCNRPQLDRSTRLKNHLREFQLNVDKDDYKIRFVRQKAVNSEKELYGYFEKVLRQGYEGLIVKNPEAPYEFKRGTNWMKLKESHTIDLKCVGVKQGKGKLKGQLGSVIVKRNGVKIDCPMGKGVTHEKAKKLWKKYKKNKKSLIGKIVEVAYQDETKDGSLFLPKFLHVRDDKSKADK